MQTIINENSGLLVDNQIPLIAALKKIHPHDIKLEAEAKIDADKSWRLTQTEQDITKDA